MAAEVRRLVIIGSGPAGYTAALYAARAELQPLVVEGATTAGGALMNTTLVENFPGFPTGVQGPELMRAMRKQALQFGATLESCDAERVTLSPGASEVVLDDGREVRAEAVIVATGSRYRRLGLPDEERLSGYGVSWCATCDGALFKERDVVVVGGGDSAMEEAVHLARFARSVTVVHRGDRFRASRIMQQRLWAEPRVRTLFGSEVVALRGRDELEAVVVRDGATGAAEEIPVAGLFVAIGHRPRSELFAGQLAMDGAGHVTVQAPTTHTSVPGVFACGDVVDHRYRQAITAAGTGCSAALDAERFLSDRRPLPPPGPAAVRGGLAHRDEEKVEAVEMPRSTPHVQGARGTPAVLTDDTFDDVVRSATTPVLVDFWATWCSPCHLMHPVLENLAARYGDRILVAKVDVDESPEVAARYGIKQMPSLRVFVDGEVAHSIAGAKPLSKLVVDLADFLG